MLSQKILNYVLQGYDFDEIYPLLLEKKYLELNTFLNKKRTKTNNFNLLLNNVFVNVKISNDKFFVKDNYLKLINENISQIKEYKNDFVIWNKNNEIVEQIQNLYIFDKLEMLEQSCYVNSSLALKQKGYGCKLNWFNSQLELILKQTSLEYDLEVFDSNLNFINFEIKNIEQGQKNTWIYYGESKFLTTAQDFNIDMLVSEDFTNQNNEIEILTEENATEFDWEEIKF